MNMGHYIWEDPRVPQDAYREGHRVRDLGYDELVASGFSAAEAWSLYHAQWHTTRSPLHAVNSDVLWAKVDDGKPLLAIERRELRTRMVRSDGDILQRKGEDWFERNFGPERLAAAKASTLCASDIEATRH